MLGNENALVKPQVAPLKSTTNTRSEPEAQRTCDWFLCASGETSDGGREEEVLISLLLGHTGRPPTDSSQGTASAVLVRVVLWWMSTRHKEEAFLCSQQETPQRRTVKNNLSASYCQRPPWLHYRRSDYQTHWPPTEHELWEQEVVLGYLTEKREFYKSVVQEYAQGHDTAVKFAILGCPVRVYNDGGLVREDVTPLPPLAFKLLQPLPFFLLTENSTSLSSSVRDGSSSSAALVSGFSGSLDSSTCSSTFSCFVRRAISCDFNPLELKERQSSSFRSFSDSCSRSRRDSTSHSERALLNRKGRVKGKASTQVKTASKKSLGM
ncbi:hypothetical protein INR49_021759 [Caranx melampygus]|nr:hypothetical protein INR49_021759 [Caranx melampygus]